MTWRERIAEARSQGRFTAADRRLAGCQGPWEGLGYEACAVAEQADRYGTALIFEHADLRIGVRDHVLLDLGGEFAGVVAVNDFDAAERLLDAIEDRALELKREAVS